MASSDPTSPGSPGESASWRRGSVGSSEVWSDARRAAHRGEAPAEDSGVAAALPLVAGLSAERLGEIISRSVASAVESLFPDLEPEARARLDVELRERIADHLEGRTPVEEEVEETPAPEEAAPPQPLPLPRDEVDPILADRIRTDFDRLGAGMHAMKVLRETAIALILEAVEVERQENAAHSVPGVSPEDMAKVDLLERRIAKLTRSIGATREALAKIALMEDFEPGIPSIYRTVQGLTRADDQFRVKRELLGDIFEANVALQKDLRELRPEPDAQRRSGRDLDGPRRNQVA